MLNITQEDLEAPLKSPKVLSENLENHSELSENSGKRGSANQRTKSSNKRGYKPQKKLARNLPENRRQGSGRKGFNMAENEWFIRLVSRTDAEFSGALKIFTQRFRAFGAVLWKVRTTSEPTIYVASQWFKTSGVAALHDLYLDQSFTGKAIKKGKSDYVRDVRTKDIEQFEQCRFWLNQNKITSLVVIPVQFSGGVKGALTLYWQKEAYSQVDIEMLDTVSLSVPQLYQLAQDQASFKLVQKANRIMAIHRRNKTQNPKRLIQDLGNLILETMNPLIASIYLRDPHQEKLATLKYTNYSRKDQAKMLSYQEYEGLISWVLKNKKPLSIFDLSDFNEKYDYWEKQYNDLWWYPKEDIGAMLQKRYEGEGTLPAWSIVVVPVIYDDQCLGAVSCFANTKQPHLYSDREQGLLEIIAGHLGETWANWIPHETASQEDRSSGLLAEVIEALNRLTLRELGHDHPRIEPILDETLKFVEKIVPEAEMSDVRLRDFSKDLLYFAAIRGDAWEQGSPSEAKARKEQHFIINKNKPKSTGAKVVVYRKTIVETDKDKIFTTLPSAKAIISAPINDGETILGVLDIRTTQARGFSLHDRRMAEILGQLMGLSLSAITKTNQQRREKSEINQFYQDFTHQIRTPVFQTWLRARELAGDKSKSLKDLREENKLIASLTLKAVRVVKSYKLYMDLSTGEHTIPNKKRLGIQELKKEMEELVDAFSKMIPPRDKINIIMDSNDFSDAALNNFNVDVDLLGHALGNVLDNAVKYSYPETTIKLTGSWSPTHFTISTTNTGLKLGQGEIPFVTQRGWRSAESNFFRREGMGIGLWIVQHIMEVHDGQLLVSATNASGHTTVKLVFPITQLGGAS